MSIALHLSRKVTVRMCPYISRRQQKGTMKTTNQHQPSKFHEFGQSFLEYALMLILISLVVIAIFLIAGDDIRLFIAQMLQTWLPAK